MKSLFRRPASATLSHFFFSFFLIGILFFLPACTVTYQPPDASSLTAFPTPTPAAGTSFSEFAKGLFLRMATSDGLSLQYTLKAPEAYGILELPCTLGHPYAADLLSDAAAQLSAYSTADLSAEELSLYRLTECYLSDCTIPDHMEHFASCLGPVTGIQVQLPILLAEYPFYDASDLDRYFALLADTPRFFLELSDWEVKRAGEGISFSREALEEMAAQCEAFAKTAEQNLLITGFYDRLLSLSELSARGRAELALQNQRLILTCVLPAYESLAETLRELIPSAKEATGLCSYPDGSAYYAALVRQKTGSDKSIPELTTLLKSALADSLLTLTDCAQNASFAKELAAYSDWASHQSANGIVCLLSEQILADFPVPPDVSYRLVNVPSVLESSISPALYLIPPIDSYTDNVIYLNPSKCDAESLFSTLAHEGYPGHLYQNVFFAVQNAHPLRSLLHFPGYDEGYATYAELYSYRYADCTDRVRRYLVAEQVAGLCLYSLTDFMIHSDGASLDTVTEFLADFGLSAETAEKIYCSECAEPGSYLPYAVGYLEIMQLKKQYFENTKLSATEKDFHTYLLSVGPSPFYLLSEDLQKK